MQQYASFAVYKGDLGRAGRGRGKPRVVGENARLTVELSDQTHLAQEAQEAIEGLDRLQLQQVLTISADDPLFRAKLSHDPAKAVVQRGFHLTEASLEILRGTDFSAIPFSPRRGGTSVS